MRKIEVLPHQKEWSSQFEEEASRLKRILAEIMIDIHHIGSTAIPNIKAKPIIDMLIEVSNISKVDAYNDELNKIGYLAMGENGIRNRRFFKKGEEPRTHHIHVFQTGDSEVKRHLLFRDYLIAHPELAKEYSDLKAKLAQKYTLDIDQYIEGKDSFIKDIDMRAQKWHDGI